MRTSCRAANNSVTKGQYFYDGEGQRVKVIDTNTELHFQCNEARANGIIGDVVRSWIRQTCEK